MVLEDENTTMDISFCLIFLISILNLLISVVYDKCLDICTFYDKCLD
jgi:hypothetical protein